MSFRPVVISLPIADRRTSLAFYQNALGLEAIGEPVEDGVPEPLQFALNSGVRLMLVPRGGFGWVVSGHDVAEPGVSECFLGITAGSEGAVDALVERARQAGARVVTAPARQAWGYCGVLADPDGHLWLVSSATFPGDDERG